MFCRSIVTDSPDVDCAGAGLPGPVAQIDDHLNLPFVQIGIDLDIVEPDLRRGIELPLPGNPVPVRLRLV